MKIQIRRVYDPPESFDGRRILVDRLWSRGGAKVALWAEEAAPSSELRKWYGHEPAKWEALRARYFVELRGNEAAVEELIAYIGGEVVTLCVWGQGRGQEQRGRLEGIPST